MAKKVQKKSKKKQQSKQVLSTPIKSLFNYKWAFAITFVLLIGCGAVIYYKYLSKDHVYIFEDIGSDTLTVFYPNMMHGKNFKKKDQPVRYSFHKGMGQAVSAGGHIMPNIFKPLQRLLKGMETAHKIPWERLYRIILGGILFFFFGKSLRLRPILCVLGACLFAFCSYYIVGSSWYVHGNYIFHMFLIILGTELVISQNKWWLFPLAVAYFVGPRLYFLTEFLVIYSVFRLLDIHDFKWRPLIKASGNLIILGILGVMLAGPILGKTFTRFKYSPRVGGEVSYSNRLQDRPVFRMATAEHNGTAIMRAFNTDLLGPGRDYKGWRNYLEAPLLYIGLLVLMLIPQLFFFVDRKRKILYGLFLGVWLWMMIFPWFRYAFYNFVGDYYKSALSLFIPLSFLILALLSFNHILKGRKPNMIALGLTIVTYLLLLFFPNAAIAEFVDKGLRMQVASFLLIYTGLIAAMRYLPKNKEIVAALLVLISIGEITYFSHYSNTRRDSISTEDWNKRTRHNDYSIEGVQYVKSIETEPFYRMDKTYGSVKSGYNDGMVQGFKGTKIYSSHNNRFQVRFMDELNIIDGSKEYNTRWLVGLSRVPLLHPLVSTKYLLSTTNNFSLVDTRFYTFLQKFNNVEVYRNDYFIPMGIPYYDYMAFSDFTKMGAAKKRRALYHTIVLEDKRISNFSGIKRRTNAQFPGEPKTLETIKELSGQAMEMTFFDHKRIVGNIDMEKDGFVFFSIPYNENWKATVDGQPVETELAQIGFIGVPVGSGQHEIELNYVPLLQKTGNWITILGLVIIAGLLFLTRGSIPNIPMVDRLLKTPKAVDQQSSQGIKSSSAPKSVVVKTKPRTTKTKSKKKPGKKT